jgi:uncharacterized protein (DUF58 family)
MPVHSRVTSRTRLVPALLAILAILTILDDYQGWRFLLLGLGGVWFLSRWWARSLAGRLSLKREMRFGWAQVGDRLEQRFTLVNQARVPAPWVELEDHSDLPGAGENLVTGIEGQTFSSWQKTYLCQQRGLFSLGPTSLHTSDPLGLFEVEVEDHSQVSLLVTPPIVPLPRIEVAPGGRAGEGKPRAHSLEQTISASGARPYQQGDGLRWVHWPSTARRNELYVRTFESRPSGDWWILLDCDQSVQVGEGEQSTLEHGIILAASLADRGLRQGQAVGLAASGQNLVWHPPRQGDGQRWEILQSLARLQPAPHRLVDLIGLITARSARDASLILITPNTSGDWLETLLPLLWLGSVPTVLLLDPVAFGSQAVGRPLSQRLAQWGIHHHLITPDLLNRPEARPGRKGQREFRVTPTGRAIPVNPPREASWRGFANQAGHDR